MHEHSPYPRSQLSASDTESNAVSEAITYIQSFSREATSASGQSQRLLQQHLDRLQTYLQLLEPTQHLRTNAMRDAVQELQDAVDRALMQSTQASYSPFNRACGACSCVKQASLDLKDTAKQVSLLIDEVQRQQPNALDASNLRKVKQAYVNKPLPDPLVLGDLARLKALVLHEAAAAPAGGPPRVVQLLGMPGMGKSTLALKLALDLEKKGMFTGGMPGLGKSTLALAKELEETSKDPIHAGAFSGGVMFLQVPKPLLTGPEQPYTQDAVVSVIADLHRSLLGILRFDELAEASGSHPSATHRALSNVFKVYRAGRSHLLVLDDVWDPAIVHHLQFANMGGVVLVTARQPMCSNVETLWLTAEGLVQLKGATAPLKAEGSVQLEGATTRLKAEGSVQLKGARQLLEAVITKVCPIDRLTPRQKRALGQVVELCDSNMLSVRLFAEALAADVTDDAWEGWINMAQTTSDSRLAPPVQIALDEMYRRLAGRTEDAQLHSALMMLQHLQARMLLPPRLLQLLWSFQHPADTVDVKDLMDELVKRSWISTRQEFQPAAGGAVEGHVVSGQVGKYLQGLPHEELRHPGQCPVNETYHLAVLLLGFGNYREVLWAQDLLQVPEPDGVPLLLTDCGLLLSWAQVADSAAFAPEPEGGLNAYMCQLYQEAAQADRVEHFAKLLVDRDKGRSLDDTAATHLTKAQQAMAKWQFAEAEQLLRQALYLREQQQTAEPLSTVSCRVHLGSCLQAQGQLEEAADQYQAALRVLEDQLGPYHPEVAAVCSSLAGVHQVLGDYGTAVGLYERAVSISGAALGPSHVQHGLYLTSLAQALLQLGHGPAAEAAAREAVTVLERALGARHPDVAGALSGLASVLIRSGRLPEAEAVCRHAVLVTDEAFGPEHPATVTALNQLVSVLNDLGKFLEAEPLCRRVVTTAENIHGEKHPTTLAALNGLAWVLIQGGKLSEAKPLCKPVLSVAEEVLGPQHPTTLAAQRNLLERRRLRARALGALTGLVGVMPSRSSSQSLHSASVDTQSTEDRGTTSPGPVLDPAAAAVHQRNLGLIYLDKGELVRAEKAFRSAVGICQERHGPDSVLTAEAKQDLARALVARVKNVKKPDDKQRLIQEAAALYTAVVAVMDAFEQRGGTHPSSHEAKLELAGVRTQLASPSKGGGKAGSSKQSAGKIEPVQPQQGMWWES